MANLTKKRMPPPRIETEQRVRLYRQKLEDEFSQVISAINSGDDLNTTGVRGHIHWDNDTPNTITVTSAGTYYQITEGSAAVASHVQNVTINTASNEMQIISGYGGVYQICLSCSFSGANNAVNHTKLFIDGVGVDIAFERKLGASGDVGSASAVGLTHLSGGETLEWRCTSDGDGDSFDYRHFSWLIVRIATGS